MSANAGSGQAVRRSTVATVRAACQRFRRASRGDRSTAPPDSGEHRNAATIERRNRPVKSNRNINRSVSATVPAIRNGNGTVYILNE